MLKSIWVAVLFLCTNFSIHNAFATESDNKSSKRNIETKTIDSKSIDNQAVPPVTDKEKSEKIADLIEEQSQSISEASNQLFGTDPANKFSLYQPTYFIFGKDNLKLQFSAKYRVAKNYNLYLAFTQVMFWNIYEQSAPFDDINYNPEAFYRFFEHENNFLRSIDLGTMHTSNGEDGEKSRSINRVYLKTNIATTIGRHSLLGELKLQQTYSKDSLNEDIVDHIGYWDLKMIITHLLVWGTTRLDIEYRIFAGKDLINIGQGGRELGLLYNLGSENFNPTFYVQYYSGYAESLLHYNEKVSVVRGGLLLYF